jgi:hypothetical protein
MLLDLVRADQVEAGLFNQPEDARSRASTAALDALTARFGRIRSATLQPARKEGGSCATSL